MLIKPPAETANEILSGINRNCTLRNFLLAILPIFPLKLDGFKIIKADNGAEVLTFPINPPVVPLEILIQDTLNQSTEQIISSQATKECLFGKLVLDSIYFNKDAIEPELPCSLNDFMEHTVVWAKREEESLSVTESGIVTHNGEMILVAVEW